MGERRFLVDACRAVGLDCRCEHLHSEPRFRVAIDHSRSRPLLYLVLRNDDSIAPHPIHADPGVPGVLFDVVEETVHREPDLGIWLPCSAHHRHVAWREERVWRVGRLEANGRIGTVGEAVKRVREGIAKA